MTSPLSQKNPHPNWKRTLYILFITQLFTAVGFSSIFPFLPFYVESLGTSTNLSVEFLSGMVFSAQAFTMMIASPFWGVIADRYGRKLMIERAAFGGAILLLLMAFVQTAEQLVILRAIQGLITGVIAANNALAAATVPKKHIGYAMGLIQVGAGIGLALGPLIGGAVADAFSYSAAFYVTSFLLFISGGLVWWGIHEDRTTIQKKSAKKNGFFSEWRQVFATPGVIPTFSMRFMSQLGRMMIVPIAPLFIKTLLDDLTYLNTFTGMVTAVSSATTTISALYLGRLGDRIGHRSIVIYSTLSATILYLMTSRVTAGWQILVLQGLVGIALGGIIPAISALLANFTQSGKAGAVYGLDNSINAAGRSVAPLVGSVVAVSFSLRASFIATAILFLLTAALAFWSLPQTRAVHKAQPIA
jgi:DHA1 family multidrug resistance protein-like MFS transporter